MRRSLPVFALALVLVGCQTTGLRLLSLVGLSREPTVIALVLEPPNAAVEALNPFPPYAGLQQAYNADTGRPASIEPCFLFQAQLGLDGGWYQCAVLSPAQYAQLPGRANLQVLAVARDAGKRVCQPALLIVPAGAATRTVAELRGKSVAFGPANDSLTHHAALQLLEAHGLAKADLALELLPVPGSLRHLPDGRAVAQAVSAGSAAGGFVTEAAWEALPEERAPGTRDNAEADPGRNEFRVLARTEALPLQLVVAAKGLDPGRAQEIREFLLGAGTRHAQAVAALGLSGYVPPTDEVTRACDALLVKEPASRPTTAPAE